MPSDDATVADVLADCGDSEHCATLLGYVQGAYNATGLDYEDVFYPLRCHHREGLALKMVLPDGSSRRLVWGKGDFIYLVRNLSDDNPTPSDPFGYYRFIKQGQADLDIVLIDPAPAEVADGR